MLARTTVSKTTLLPFKYVEGERDIVGLETGVEQCYSQFNENISSISQELGEYSALTDSNIYADVLDSLLVHSDRLIKLTVDGLSVDAAYMTRCDGILTEDAFIRHF